MKSKKKCLLTGIVLVMLYDNVYFHKLWLILILYMLNFKLTWNGYKENIEESNNAKAVR